jgi:Chalcone isomerase-like
MEKLGRRVMLGAVALATLAVSGGAFALEPGKDGYYHTGSATRVKKVVLVNVKVYEVNHYMKALPDKKSKQAVVDAACDKKFMLRMLRDVEAEKMREALTESYGRTGADKGKIAQLLNTLSTELKENSYLIFAYNAEQKVTMLKVGDKQVSVPGEDFMKSTWNIWFGNGINDQSGIGDQLIAKLP